MLEKNKSVLIMIFFFGVLFISCNYTYYSMSTALVNPNDVKILDLNYKFLREVPNEVFKAHFKIRVD